MANYKLQILHHADFEGNTPALNDAPKFAALIDYFDDTYTDSTLKISGGDNWIASPWANAQDSEEAGLAAAVQAAYEQDLGLAAGTLSNLEIGKYDVDQALLNLMGFQVSAIGNHEFDDKAAGFAGASIPKMDNSGSTSWANVVSIGSYFPYISTNLDFSGNSDLSAAFTTTVGDAATFGLDAASALSDDLSPYLVENGAKTIAPATTIVVNGETIGFVGATTQRLNTITTESEVTVVGTTIDDMDLLAKQLQVQVDQLSAQGVNKIIALTHLQDLDNEKQLATKLSGVDILLGGGSDAILADSNDLLKDGDVASGTYPLSLVDSDGNPILLVNTDGQYNYLGRLVVEFDENGFVIPASIDSTESGAYATSDSQIASLYGAADPYASETLAGRVKSVVDGLDDIIGAKVNVVAGYSNVYLQGDRAFHRNQESNLGNLVADAMLAQARDYISVNPGVIQNAEYLVAIKNSGGIRQEIGSKFGVSGPEAPPNGVITQLDLETTLAFNNRTVLYPTTVQGLVNLLERGLFEAGETDGGFPQIGGMRIAFNPNSEAGSRLERIAIIDSNGDETAVLMEAGSLLVTESTPLNIAANDFTVNNDGDGYPFAANIAAGGSTVDISGGVAKAWGSVGTEQTAVKDYLAANHSTPETAFSAAETPIGQDTRIVVTADRLKDYYGETVAIDLDGKAGQVVKILNAVFGEAVAKDPSSVGSGLYFADQGLTASDLVTKALVFAGLEEKSDLSVISHVYENIFGVAPQTDNLAFWVGIIEGNNGVDRSPLIAAMANLDQNIETIGLNQMDHISYIPV